MTHSTKHSFLKYFPLNFRIKNSRPFARPQVLVHLQIAKILQASIQKCHRAMLNGIQNLFRIQRKQDLSGSMKPLRHGMQNGPQKKVQVIQDIDRRTEKIKEALEFRHIAHKLQDIQRNSIANMQAILERKQFNRKQKLPMIFEWDIHPGEVSKKLLVFETDQPRPKPKPRIEHHIEYTGSAMIKEPGGYCSTVC